MRKLSFVLGTVCCSLFMILSGTAAQADGTRHDAELRGNAQRRADRQHHRQTAAQRRSDGRRDRDEGSGQDRDDHGLPLRAAADRTLDRRQADALSAVTDDNGSIHRVSATRSGDKLAVNADGRGQRGRSGDGAGQLWNMSAGQDDAGARPEGRQRHAGLGRRPRQGAARRAGPRHDRAPLFDQDQRSRRKSGTTRTSAC